MVPLPPPPPHLQHVWAQAAAGRKQHHATHALHPLPPLLLTHVPIPATVFEWVTVRKILWDAGAVALVVVLTVAAYQLLSRAVGALEKRDGLSTTIGFLIRRVLRWVAVVVGVMLALQTLGVLENAWAGVTALFALLAAAFVAVWSVLSNIFCAILLIVHRPFEVGDTVEIPGEPGGIKGKAVDFNLMYTTLQADDGAEIRVPNSLFFQRPLKRFRGEVQVSLDEQLTKQRPAK
jgi:small-conductance mechanosensitive channel